MKEIAAALAKAQADFKPATFDKKNPHFGSPYASLTSVMSAVKDALSKNSLAISQSVDDGKVITRLIHSSGEMLETSVPLLVGKQDMQGLGSAITYGRRYGISALLGIVTDEDDDGNAASGGFGANSESTPPRQATSAPRDPNQKYMIDFGKWNRKSLEQVLRDEGPDAIMSYVTYLEDSAQSQGKQVNAKAALFIREAEQLLGAVENGASVNTEAQNDIPF